MDTKTNRVLFESAFYVVCHLQGVGLTVQSKRKGSSGKLMREDHPQYGDWLPAWTQDADKSEGDALCRAFLG